MSDAPPAYPGPATNPGYPQPGGTNPSYPQPAGPMPQKGGPPPGVHAPPPGYGAPPPGGHGPPQQGGYGPPPGQQYGPPPPGGYAGQPGGPPPAGYPAGPPPPGGYGPAQPGYGAPPPTSTVVINQPAMHTTVIQQFRETPVNTRCPFCQADIITATTHETGTFTWLLCAILCIVGCALCAWIPCVIDDCKDTVHTCPSCHQVVSVHKRM